MCKNNFDTMKYCTRESCNNFISFYSVLPETHYKNKEVVGHKKRIVAKIKKTDIIDEELFPETYRILWHLLCIRAILVLFD